MPPSGFPDRLRFTPVPDPFLRELLPQMDDLAEVKATLLVFWALYRKRGYPRFVTFPEVQQALGPALAEPEVRRALEQAVRRGTLLHLTQDTEGQGQDIYLVNNAEGRRALETGVIPRSAAPQTEVAAPRPSIFTLYEENIGLLTPLIAEELEEAERKYPLSWIEEAIREAVRAKAQKWRYVARILERWQQEGRDSGEPGGDPKTAREKYLRGKYGHLVQG